MTSLPAQAIEALEKALVSEYVDRKLVCDALTLLRAGQSSIRADALEEAAKVAEKWSTAQALRLACGEMTAQELRTALAVVNGIVSRIRALKENASGNG